MRSDFGSNIIMELEKKLGLTSGKTLLRDFSGLKSAPGVDVKKAFQIISQLESGGGYVIGDSGTSFGSTQVQLGSFLSGLAKDPQAEALTGISAESLKNMNASWSQAKAKMASMPLWKTTSVDANEVASFARQHPKSVVKRREGTTIRFSPETFTIVRLPSYQGNTLNLDVLEQVGLDTNSPTVRRQLSEIISQYVTDAVVRNAIAKLLVMRADPAAYNRFQNTFSQRNVRNNQQLRDLADRVAQGDFMNKVNHVLNSVQESGYNTNAPGAFNIYQLIAIANASGAGRVDQFLRSKKPFGSGHLHYLQRANPLIAKVTGLSTSFPPGGGLGGFQAYASLNISKRASFVLNFPSQYTEDLRSGKRQMTIRQGDIPVEVNQVVRCETYSGAYICDVIITSKEMMSTTRIRKAFGQKVADELESKFGPDGRFMVIRFALKENKNDDDFGGNSFGKSVPTPEDNSNLEHIPNGREMISVEPGAYHASADFGISKMAELEQIKSIWDLAEMIGLADDADEWLKQHGLEEEETDSDEEEDEDVSEKWREKERKRMEELVRQRKQQQQQTQAPAPTPVPPPQPKFVAPPQEEGEEEYEDTEENKEDIDEYSDIERAPEEEEKATTEKKPIMAPRLTFEERMRGVDIPTLEEEKEDEDEDIDTLSNLIKELEGTEDVEEVLSKIKDEEKEEGLRTATNVRLENKKTIYGFKMTVPEEGWHSVPTPPAMAEQARGLFSASNLRTFDSMNKLFLDPKTWTILNAQPNKQAILQQWILPALIYNIGKRWFEIYANRNKLAAFSLFSPVELEQAIAGKKPLDQTEVGKDYMKKIVTHVTDAANSYFSRASNRNAPISNYINAIVRHKMEREIGFANGYRLRERQICAICKGEEKWGVAVREMVEKKIDIDEFTEEQEITPRVKPIKSVIPYSVKQYIDTTQKEKSGKKSISVYTCENCARKADELMSRDVKQAQTLVSTSQRKINELEEKLKDANASLLNIQERITELGEKPELLEKLADAQKQIDKLNSEKNINNGELSNRKELLAHHMQQVRKYKNQTNVPFVHLMCPNPTCPGKRIPLTSIDWSQNDFWKSPNGKSALEFLRINYGIHNPLATPQEQHSEDFTMPNENLVEEVVLSKAPTRAKLNKLFGSDYGKRIDLSKIKEFLQKYDDILKKNKPFRETILKINRTLEEIPALKSVLEAAPTQIYHIPPREIRDVPFICPHDNVKFTINEVIGKSGEIQISKGQEKRTEVRGGLFYKPYMKAYWYKEGEEEQAEADYEKVGSKNDNDELMTYRELVGLSRDIFLKRYWDRYAIIEKFKRDNPFLAAKPEKLAANPRFQEQLAILKLYDSVREFSADNPETYVGWLASREFRLTFEQRKNGVTPVTSVAPTKAQTEEIYAPILQKWFDAMTADESGFEKYGLNTWLVNEKEDGIPSYPVQADVKEKVGSEGTYFLAKIEPLGQSSLGFKMNLVSKQRRRGFGSQPRIIRVAGAWEIARETAEQFDKLKAQGQVALTREEAYNLMGSLSNRVSEIRNHDYREGVFEDDADFLPGNYMLIQAYLMPTIRNWKPIENIYRLRTDTDDERIFAEFGQLAVLNENNPTFWAKFRKDVAQYKKDPEAVARFIRSKLDKEKKASRLSSRGKFLLSIYDY